MSLYPQGAPIAQPRRKPVAALGQCGRAALWYAEKLGWYVLPLYPIRKGVCSCRKRETCDSPGKHPISKLVANGLHGATTDPAQVRAWWADWPDANVGIRTGAISGIWVLDVDPRHGGDDSLADLDTKIGGLPDTVEAKTGSGGGTCCSSTRARG